MTPDTPAPKRRSSLGRWLLAAGVVVALAGATWFVATLGSPAPAATPAASLDQAGPSGSSRQIHALLFYVAENGTALVESGRDIAYGATPVEQARLIVEAQLQPPPRGFMSAIPVGTTVHTVFLTPRGEAYVDLSHEIASGHTGGSLDEALTVFTIVNALTVNLPNVTAVQILVDGKAQDTLAGHIDLRHPLERSLKWVRKGQ